MNLFCFVYRSGGFAINCHCKTWASGTCTAKFKKKKQKIMIHCIKCQEIWLQWFVLIYLFILWILDLNFMAITCLKKLGRGTSWWLQSLITDLVPINLISPPGTDIRCFKLSNFSVSAISVLKLYYHEPIGALNDMLLFLYSHFTQGPTILDTDL